MVNRHYGVPLDIAQELLERLPDAVLVIAPGGRVEGANTCAQALFGWNRSELSGISIEQLLPGLLQRAAPTRGGVAGTVMTLSQNARRRDGTEFPVDIALSLFGTDGDPHICILRDVSELRRVEKELRERQRVLDTLMSNLPGLVYRCRNDPQWTMEFVSEGCIALTGYQPTDLLDNQTLAYADLIHPDDTGSVWEDVQQALAAHLPFELQYRIRARDGSEKWVWERGRGIRGDDGALLGLEGYITDISEAHRFEQELAERERRYKALLESVPDLLLRIRRDGTYLDYKPARDFPTYVPPEQFLGRKSTEILPPEVAIEHLALIERTLTTGEIQVDRYKLEVAGETRHYETRFVPAGTDEILSIVRDITSERRVAEQIAILASAVEQTTDAVMVTDVDGFIQYVNPAFERITGYSNAEVYGQQPSIVKSDEHDDAVFDALWQTIRRGNSFQGVMVNRRKDGSTYHEEKTVTPLKDAQGLITHFVSAGRDISERRRYEDTIARLGRILDRSANEIYMFDARTLRFVQVNEGARRNLGYSMEELQALTPLDLTPDISYAEFDHLLAPLRAGAESAATLVASHRRKDGSVYPVEMTVQLARAEEPQSFVAIIQDITERKRAEARLSYLAYYDTVTGLPNRAFLYDKLRSSMTEADRHGRLVAVLMLDLDRFKIINDTLGHAVGDGLLKAIGERLAAVIRSGDTVARLGGDEFALVLADVADADDVANVVRKVLARFEAPLHIGSHELHITPSIGIALYPLDGGNIDDLLRHADSAMYQAKEQGRNNFQFFTAELNQRAERRLLIENALHQALKRDEFWLEYQPQVLFADGRIVGCEALLRWRQPELGVVPPLDFVPIAEDTGLILPIGEWVLRTACRDLAAWRAAGHCDLTVAVNVSVRQLRLQDLPALLRRILDETGVPGEYLTIEITEGTLLRDAEETLVQLRALRALGVNLAIDDFGTGYSSLAYLKRFPLDTLKVDRSFVRDVNSDSDSAAIVRTIIAMARSLDIEVIAEGVENPEQATFLRDLSCTCAQGFLFSRAVPAAAFTALLGTGVGEAPPVQ